jgi:tetratricopeptide (TPR) repeat protein
MTSPQAGRGGRIRLLMLIFLIVAGLGLWRIRTEYLARQSLSLARVALAAGESETACRHLEACLTSWPTVAEVHFLYGQALRRTARYSEANRHLTEAARLGWNTVAISAERAMVSANSGVPFSWVEPALRAAAQGGMALP